MTAATAVDNLRQAYGFDLIEEDWLQKGLFRGGSSVLTIPENELGTVPKSDRDVSPIKEVRTQEVDLPETVEMLFSNATKDYQQDLEFAKRITLPNPTMNSRDVKRIDLGALVDAPDDIKQRAETWLYTMWQERITVSTTIP